MDKDRIAKDIEMVYRALHQQRMNIVDVILMSKEATLAGNTTLVSMLSNAIFARADEQDKVMKDGLLVIMQSLLLAARCARKPPSDRSADLEDGLQEMMSDATPVGHSARLNKEGISGEEKYVIDKVFRLGGDTWLFYLRIQFGPVGREGQNRHALGQQSHANPPYQRDPHR